MSTEARLKKLEDELEELRSDLRLLRTLMEQDHASALNKIRYVTEKVLHQLCSEHAVSWGKSEPTLENMIGPLIAGKIIPKNVAIHVRTVQTNASPGSHFQETPLGATHVQVAQMALLDFLEWFHKSSLSDDAPSTDGDTPSTLRSADEERAEEERAADSVRDPGEKSPPKPAARRPWWLLGVAGAAAAALVWLHPWRSSAPPARDEKPAASAAANIPAVATASATPPREPAVGLSALERFRNPKGSEASLLSSESFWDAAARDFEVSSSSADAPIRWRAAHRFARGEALIMRGDFEAAKTELRAAIDLDDKWALPWVGLSSALAHTDKIDDALEAARTAERLDGQWHGAIAAAARVHASAGHFDQAILEYRRALAAAPKDALLLSDLALAYHAARLDPEAERYGKMALDADPDLVNVRVMLAERALEENKGDEALAHASRAVGVEPNNTAALLAEADALALAGKKPEALAGYKKTVAAWKQHGRDGAPEARLALVEKAAAKDELPPPRAAARSAPPRSAPAEKPAPIPRSHPKLDEAMDL